MLIGGAASLRLFGAALFADPAAVKLGAIYSLQMLFFVVVAAATAKMQ
jgi:hypothetical protein